ncbi:hypothetical protein D9Q98_004416 [Chlorella vulgaris]|uniref:Uncharacterized protein n=1 Tax=Chlorella vulgaris TaxID=3077 RepID=A0A9D4YXW8_CHLVU|nr:hypothetical protein D9Q98_004416 [Chlorella vulgaris]
MGDAARHRGTGSRAVPHRLNAEERKQYDLAKAKGVLTLAGSGYRRERKGSPAANIFRQWCDAKAQPCVLLAKGASAATGDTVLVDLSVLRLSDVRQYRERCRDIARQHGCSPQPDSAMQSPFTVILPAKLINAMLSSGGDGGGGISNLDGASDPFQASTSPASQSTSGGAGGDEDDSVAAQLAELRASQPIWQQPPLLEGYTTDRGAAKALAKALAEQLPGVGPDA